MSIDFFKGSQKNQNQDVADDLEQIDNNFPENISQKLQDQKHPNDASSNKQIIFMIYPDNKFKKYWDILITLNLILQCIYIPYNLAFVQDQDITQIVIESITNSLFGLDLIFSFFTAYYDSNFKIVEDYKQISIQYLKGWFTFDIITLIPLNQIINIIQEENVNANSIVRILRLARIQRMIKLVRLIRLIRIFKEQSRLLNQTRQILQLGDGFEKLFLFIFVSIILVHVYACVWITVPSIKDDQMISWIENGQYQNLDSSELYMVSIYFCITTFTTVGYGDIHALNYIEMIFCICIQITGAMGFSYATSILASIFQNQNIQNAQFNEKLLILNRIFNQYQIPKELYLSLKQSLKYKFNKDVEDLNNFMDNLPQPLKIELGLFIYEKTYKDIEFLQGRSNSFISWICPLLKPQIQKQNAFIYFEGDDIVCINFLQKGKCGYVLPRHQNVKYYSILQGQFFGVIDIIASLLLFQNQIDLDEWIQYKDKLKRQSTLMTQTDCELLTLSIQNLQQMRYEFLDAYESIFQHSFLKMSKILRLKIKAIEICNHFKRENNDNTVFLDTLNSENEQVLFNDLIQIQELFNSSLNSGSDSESEKESTINQRSESIISKIKEDEKELSDQIPKNKSKNYDLKKQISQVYQRNYLNKSQSQSSVQSFKEKKIIKIKGRSKSIDINKENQGKQSVALKRYKNRTFKIGNDDTEIKQNSKFLISKIKNNIQDRLMQSSQNKGQKIDGKQLWGKIINQSPMFKKKEYFQTESKEDKNFGSPLQILNKNVNQKIEKEKNNIQIDKDIKDILQNLYVNIQNIEQKLSQQQNEIKIINTIIRKNN